MRSIGTGQWRDVSGVNQKREGHAEPKGLARFIYLFRYLFINFFMSILITLWPNNEPDAAAAAAICVCARYPASIRSVSVRM